jgi:hypothetical protein
MTILETIGGIFGALFVIGFFGGLIYVMLFKAEASNYPTAVRGTGICLLAGALKVIFIFAEDLSTSFSSDWLNYVLIAMVVVGMLVMMSGFGGDSK